MISLLIRLVLFSIFCCNFMLAGEIVEFVDPEAKQTSDEWFYEEITAERFDETFRDEVLNNPKFLAETFSPPSIEDKRALLNSRRNTKSGNFSDSTFDLVVWAICKHQDSQCKKTGLPYYPIHLKVLGKDPSFTFKLKYFHKCAIKLVSGSRFNPNNSRYISPKEIDAYLSTDGCHLQIDFLEVTDHSATADVNFFWNKLNGLEYTAFLKRSKKGWVVVRIEIHSIS